MRDKMNSHSTVTLADGRTIAWRECGQGHPLVMLHGWSMSGAVFTEMAERLGDEFRVLCPDLPGHGGSASLDLYALSSLSASIGEWLEILDINNPSLLGWSLGGQVALQMVLEGRVDCRQLMLISTTPCFNQGGDWKHGLPQGQVRTMERQLRSRYMTTLEDFFDLQFAPGEIAPARRRQILDFAVRAAKVPASEDSIATLGLLSRTDLRGQLQALPCSVMVQHGVSDAIIPSGAGAYLSARLDAASVSMLEGIGHAPFFSRPDLCEKLWREFLHER